MNVIGRKEDKGVNPSSKQLDTRRRFHVLRDKKFDFDFSACRQDNVDKYQIFDLFANGSQS